MKQLKTQPCAVAAGEQQAQLKRVMVPPHLPPGIPKKAFSDQACFSSKGCKCKCRDKNIPAKWFALSSPGQPHCTAEASSTKSPSMCCCFLFSKAKVQVACCSAARVPRPISAFPALADSQSRCRGHARGAGRRFPSAAVLSAPRCWQVAGTRKHLVFL